jgi:hypothetical protein
MGGKKENDSRESLTGVRAALLLKKTSRERTAAKLLY